MGERWCNELIQRPSCIAEQSAHLLGPRRFARLQRRRAVALEAQHQPITLHFFDTFGGHRRRLVTERGGGRRGGRDGPGPNGPGPTKRAGANADGTRTLGEFAARGAEVFTKADANMDGVVTVTEMQSMGPSRP